MSQHTKEPWRASGAEVVAGEGRDMRVVAEPYRNWRDGPILDQPTMENNARRIAACVNACAGISTEDLAAIADGEGWDGIHRRLTGQVEAITMAHLSAVPSEGLVFVGVNTGTRDERLNGSISRRVYDLLCKARADGKTKADFIVVSGPEASPAHFTEMTPTLMGKVGFVHIRDYREVLEALQLLMVPKMEKSSRWEEAKAGARKVLNRVRGLYD